MVNYYFLKNLSKFINFTNQLIVYVLKTNKMNERLFRSTSKKFKNFIFAGRLDVNSEGLLIATNDGEVARSLELPKNKFARKYRVRVYGVCEEKKIDI